jgi:tripartite-type tricarboxylate transporter receptor subunit TctC
MRGKRKNLRLVLASICALGLGDASARAADNWPAQQINIIVPFSAGGSTDILARVIAQHMQAKLGQPVVVQNKSGASGGIGSAAVAKSPPDGYTLLVGTGGSQVTGPLTAKNSPFDPQKDLVPVTLIAKLPSLLVVNSKIPATNVPELIAYLKANPDKVSFGSAGTGTASHLAVELFKTATGTQMTHVPYRSTGDNANSLAGGHVQLAMDISSVLLPQTRAGLFRAIAVSSTDRVSSAPDIPTIGETLPGFEVVAWIGMLAPAGTPRPVIDTLAAEVKRILALPEVAKNLDSAGAVASPTSPEEFGAFLKDEQSRWRGVIAGLGLLGSN